MRSRWVHVKKARVLDRVDRALLKADRWAVIAILAAMATMVFVNVVLRFATDHSLLWVEEASRYPMIWLTFLGRGPVPAQAPRGEAGVFME